MCFVVYEETLIAGILNKKLTDKDLAKKAASTDFAACPENEVDCAIVQRLLERNKIVLI